MSVQNVYKMWSKEGGTITNVKSDSLDQTYSFTEGYSVLHGAGTAINDILFASGIPAAGQQHSTGLAAFATTRSYEAVGPIYTVVTVGYEGESPDPESTEVEWTDTTSSEPIDRDFDGAAIVTENGEQIEGLTFDLSDQVAVVRRKFLTINTSSISAYRHAVNSDTFLGWPPGTARLVGFSAKNRFKYGATQEQWDVTARFQFRRGIMGATDAQAWYKRWRHEGMYVNVGGIVRRAVDHFGQETSRPVLLKTDGTQETDPDAALFKYTKVYDNLPYSALGLL